MAKKERPDVVNGKTPRFQTNCGKLYITLNKIDEELGEVKIELGKSGHCQKTLLTFIGVLLSKLLQTEITQEELHKFLKKNGVEANCGQHFIIKGAKYFSCLDLISRNCIDELNKEEKCANEKKT